MDLVWTELINIADSIFPSQRKRGVYVWGFTLNEKFIPYYVGISNNIYKRMMQHVSSIINGSYVIYHKKSLENFAGYKYLKVNSDITDGKVYSPNFPVEYKGFVERRHLLKEHIDFMVDNFTFSYSSIEEDELKEIEKICINQIGKKILQNNRSGITGHINIIHNGDSRITELFKK